MHERLQHIRDVCRQRPTIRRARSHLSVLPNPPPRAEYACAYLASEHLQNADALVSRAPTRGGLKAKAFWRLVGDVERALRHAARTKVALPNGRTFTYKRLPHYRPRCKACQVGDLPCLVARRMSGSNRRGRSDKCQVCFIRKAKCERNELQPAVNNALQPVPNAEPTLDAVRSRAPTPDDVPVAILFGKGKAREPPPIVASLNASNSVAPKRPQAPPQTDASPSKRRPPDENAAPSPALASYTPDSGAHPRTAASSSRPLTTANTAGGETPAQHLALAHAKALDIVRHAARAGGALPLELRVPIREMGVALGKLGELCSEPGEPGGLDGPGAGRLRYLEGERLCGARALVQAAAHEVAALDEARVGDLVLRMMVRCLKSRLRDLGRVGGA
ncbi:hypothetical protein PsYK624_039860 [Phanerochaete sordida]|uniref:Uncharacterized protein n=1 Tax=Phanerochaete sordida TaxID=48140 RepID=A0A9P3G2M7_9APHY|nr:hypothetical protein PsYK624_039860 [Phanerochaete sordida]